MQDQTPPGDRNHNPNPQVSDKLVLTLDNVQPIFADLLRSGRDSAALAIVRQQPEQALACLQSIDSHALRTEDCAKVLEFVIGEQKDSRNRELLRDHLTPGRLAEMLVAQGDLDSAAASLADPETITLAVAQIASDQDGSLEEFRRWAHKLKDRDDWDMVLQATIGDHSFREWIVMAQVQHFAAEEYEGEIPLSSWDDVGIDIDLAVATLSKLAEAKTLDREFRETLEEDLEKALDQGVSDDSMMDSSQYDFDQPPPPAATADKPPPRVDKHDDQPDSEPRALTEIDL